MSEPEKVYDFDGKFVGIELTADDPEWNGLSRHLYNYINSGRGEDDPLGLFRKENGEVGSFETLKEVYTDENGNLRVGGEDGFDLVPARPEDVRMIEEGMEKLRREIGDNDR